MSSSKSSFEMNLKLYGAWCIVVRMVFISLVCLPILDGMPSYGREPLIKYSEWYDSAKNLVIDNLSDRKPIVRADMLRFALPNNETLEMMKVKRGTFFMREADYCQEVTFSHDFWIGRYEVTEAQYMAVMGKSKIGEGGGKMPRNKVAWKDAKEFCEKLNKLCYNHEEWRLGYYFALPTEAQWEYAARGGAQGAARGKNYRYSGSDDVTQVAWCKTTSDNKPHKVGELRPNELGIYDMNGNVWEWCSDVFKKNDSKKPVVDAEEGGVFGGNRVIRGGCYCTPPEDFNVFTRHGEDPSLQDVKNGFRVALVWEKKTDGAWAGKVMKGTKRTVRLFSKDELDVDVLAEGQIVLLGYPSDYIKSLRENLRQEFGKDKVSFQEDNGMMFYTQQMKSIVEKTPSVVIMNISRRYAKDDTKKSLFEEIIQYDMKFLNDSSIPCLFIVSDKSQPEDVLYEAKLKELNQSIVNICDQKGISVLNETSPLSEVVKKIRELTKP